MSKKSRAGRVREEHLAVGVVERDEVGGRLDRATEHRELTLDGTFFGDVHDRPDVTVHAARRIDDRCALGA